MRVSRTLASAAILLAAGFLDGCGTEEGASVPLQAIEGTAQDAKSGAVIVSGDAVIYIENLPAWPAAVHGKKVRATGVRKEQKLIPDPSSDPDRRTAGAEGTQTVLTGARWKVIE